MPAESAVERATIEALFADMRSEGVSLDRDMLWGYFFTHAERATLERVRPLLEAAGYTYVDIMESSNDEDDDGHEHGGDHTLYLHVERAETHTPASLYRRCEELTELAEQHGLDSFDGFDVGNVDGTGLYPT